MSISNGHSIAIIADQTFSHCCNIEESDLLIIILESMGFKVFFSRDPTHGELVFSEAGEISGILVVLKNDRHIEIVSRTVASLKKSRDCKLISIGVFAPPGFNVVDPSGMKDALSM